MVFPPSRRAAADRNRSVPAPPTSSQRLFIPLQRVQRRLDSTLQTPDPVWRCTRELRTRLVTADALQVDARSLAAVLVPLQASLLANHGETGEIAEHQEVIQELERQIDGVRGEIASVKMAAILPRLEALKRNFHQRNDEDYWLLIALESFLHEPPEVFRHTVPRILVWGIDTLLIELTKLAAKSHLDHQESMEMAESPKSAERERRCQRSHREDLRHLPRRTSSYRASDAQVRFAQQVMTSKSRDRRWRWWFVAGAAVAVWWVRAFVS